MLQSKLDKFFNIKIKHSSTHKKCFIYDPDNYKAFFDYSPSSHKDTFVTNKSGLTLYYRKSTNHNIRDIAIPDVSFNTKNIPLLKSNLQKAIRRCELDIAINTSLALLKLAPTEFFRRLPIIVIEDVALIDTFPIIIWFMIADKDYKLCDYDIDILLNIIWNLCNISDSFPFYENGSKRRNYPRNIRKYRQSQSTACSLLSQSLRRYVW